MSMFTNAHQFSIRGGTYNNVARDQINLYESPQTVSGNSALDILSEFIKDVGAVHDSAQRYPPPKCHPETRKGIQTAILEWIHSQQNGRPVFWIHGPAGVGKSAVAQTIAELAEIRGSLGASFFFSRSHGERGRAEYLFPTIAYQLAVRIGEFNKVVTQTLRKDPGVLRSSLDIQFEELFLNTCGSAMKLGGKWMHQPRVIIIDGLDECTETVFQKHIILLIASVLKDKLPFRFLIFSRPEPQIREAFQAHVPQSLLRQTSLDKDSWDARQDMKRFLESGFSNIRTQARTSHIHFPPLWPGREVIDELIEKACGQFVYATTVLKFVGEEHSHPMEQLSIVLGLKTAARGNSPFKELDVLYHHILFSYPDHNKVTMILGALIHLSSLSGLRRWNNHPCGPAIEVIEALLGLHTGEVLLVLRGMHSVLNIDGTHIRILHASFRDYLCHKSRSGQFYIRDSTFVAHLFLSFSGVKIIVTEPRRMSVLVNDFEPHRDYMPFIISRSSNVLLLSMFIFTPLLNTLLLGFIPLGIISQFLHWSTALRFSFSFLAAMNLTEFLNDTMEYIATGLDQKHTGILNASFGNIVKFFVGIAVLFQGKIVIVQDMMLGSILANMLLILGWSFLAAGMKFRDCGFSITSAQVSSSFMILACITFTIPPTYCGFCTYQSLTLSDPEKWENVLIISRAASILLIVVYLAYLFFQLKTHGYLFENVDSFQEEDDDTQNKESQETSTMTYLVALWATLAIITALATLYVISLMEEFAEQYFIPRTFIGLILLPLVNVDGTSALRMAMRGQLKTTIDICIGSSIQIIAFVIPLLVLIGWISGHQFPLLFGIFEIITIFVSVLLTSDLLKDGRSNYLKGLILLSVYVVIALASSQL